jgi:hypothetical protein
MLLLCSNRVSEPAMSGVAAILIGWAEECFLSSHPSSINQQQQAQDQTIITDTLVNAQM